MTQTTVFKGRNLELSDHAFKRMQERFPTQSKNKQSATSYVRQIIGDCKYIGIIADSLGVDGHLFVYKKTIAIYVDIDNPTVKTIYEFEKEKPNISFRKRIEKIYETEYRKIDRAEAAKKKSLHLIVAQNEAKIAELKLRKVKTRSSNVVKECEIQIKKLQEEITNANAEFKKLQNQKRQIAFAIATETY